MIDTFILLTLAGLFFISLGSVIYYYKAGDMINFFNPKKHDKAKVSRIAGRNLLLMGLTNLLFAIISLLVNQQRLNFLLTVLFLLVLIGIIVTVYQIFVCARLDSDYKND
ncbi:DUF3784 domain-containing protein [Amphibacillus jilinensis]|uniref:DUF3784 domain-containing protein n=1 Tax=Amphibacillus jilinensis TaxID=1216008 RepID=UPI0002F32A93|nr:DUF3784 domain-containing protein [Amphibacillus jilinensis]